MGRRKSNDPVVSEEDVEKIYLAYPKKGDKKPAITAIRNALKRHAAVVILEGVAEMASQLRKQGLKRGVPDWRFVKYAQGYFNGERYLWDVEDFCWFEAKGRSRHPAEDGKYADLGRGT